MYLLMALETSMITLDVIVTRVPNILAAMLTDPLFFRQYKMITTFLSTTKVPLLEEFRLGDMWLAF